jgi:hypothetical protein
MLRLVDANAMDWILHSFHSFVKKWKEMERNGEKGRMRRL